jgi:hypothetical protein
MDPNRANVCISRAQGQLPKYERGFLVNIHVEYHEINGDETILNLHRDIFRYPDWVPN